MEPHSSGPLAGKLIVVTRADAQAGAFAHALAELGAEVIEFPTIAIVPAPDFAPLDTAIANLDGYDWLIFTSANGVKYFRERVQAASMDIARIRAKLCTIGPATRAAVEALGLKVDLLPKAYVAESLVEAFADVPLTGARILLPRAAVARDVAPEALRARGATVDVVEAYRTILPPDAAEKARAIFGAARKPDWVTVTSSSTVKNLVAAAGIDALKAVRIASIGPVTTASARACGLDVAVEAAEFTTAGLIAAMVGAQ